MVSAPMRIPFKSLLTLALLALLGVFVWQNQVSFFGSPEAPAAPLRFLGARFQAPLGLVLLAFIALLCLTFLIFALGLRAQTLLELRRNAKELEASRRLADSAELSRLAELKTEMLARFAEQTQEIRALHNSLAASLGELEDRLLPPPAGGGQG